MELRSDATSVHIYAECLTRWVHRDLAHRIPGGITGHEFHARYDAAVRAIGAGRADDETVAVFSHGGAIRVYTALAAGLDPETAADLRMMNTGMSVLTGDPTTGWQLSRWISEPLGGAQLEDPKANDVTGESAAETAGRTDDEET